MADPTKPARLDSGARTRVAVPPPVEARVLHIRELMESGAWARATARELAQRWGVSEVRVREHAAEASRQLRPLDREAAQARVEALLAKAETAAAYSKTRAADLTKVAQAWARLYGLDRPAPRGATADDRGSSGAREMAAEDWWEGDGDGAK